MGMRVAAIPLLALLSAFGPAGGHGEGHGALNWFSCHGLSGDPPLGFALINFAVLLWALSRWVWPKLRAAAAARHDAVARELEEARRIRAEAEDKIAEYGRRLESIEQEIAGVVESIRKEAEHEKARALDSARAHAARIRKDAEFTIAQEIKQARADLRRELIEAATAHAEDILKTRAGAEDDRRLADEFVATVGGRS